MPEHSRSERGADARDRRDDPQPWGLKTLTLALPDEFRFHTIAFAPAWRQNRAVLLLPSGGTGVKFFDNSRFQMFQMFQMFRMFRMFRRFGGGDRGGTIPAVADCQSADR
jgi:hypothetical protein